MLAQLGRRGHGVVDTDDPGWIVYVETPRGIEPTWAQTRREHRPLVREHARFVAAGERAVAPVREWLVDQAMEHERPSLLFGALSVELRLRGIERPAVNEMMRLVGWARERAHELTYQRLAPQLTDETRAILDRLLVATGGQSKHAWLRARPTAVSGAAMRRELDKRAFLIETVGADQFGLSALSPNRRSWLAQTGRQQTNQALARMAPARRYPVLMAFCVEALERSTDDALEVFDRALGAADRAAQRKREEVERHGRREVQMTVRRFIDLSRVVLKAHDSGSDVLRLVERRIGIEQLRTDLDRAEGVARPHGTGHLEELLSDHGATGRKLLASVIDSLALRVTGTDEDELLRAQGRPGLGARQSPARRPFELAAARRALATDQERVRQRGRAARQRIRTARRARRGAG